MNTLKKMLLYLSLILIGSSLLWLSSCKKDEYAPYDSYVDGYIRDAVTLDSVAGAEVQLWQDDRGGSTKPRDYDRILATTTTDSNGYYRIDFKCDPLKTTAIVAKKQLYHYNDQVDMSMFACGRSGINYTMSPLSWIRIHIKNSNPANADDLITFSMFSLKGMDIDTIFFREIETMNSQLYIWHVTKNGNKVQNSAYITCTPHDTCDLNIFY